VTSRRGLALLLLCAVARASIAAADEGAVDAGSFPGPVTDAGQPPAQGQDAGVAAASPAPAAPTAQRADLIPSTAAERATPRSSGLREVPVLAWICGGVAAALLGVGIGFGVAASDIEHRAGSNLSASGVDLSLTRKTALAGQMDANVANGLFIGAGVVALVGLALVAFSPEPASRWQAPNPAPSP